MNHREPPQPSAARRQAAFCLVIALLSVLLHDGAQALPSLRAILLDEHRPANPIAYLPTIGAPALRFQEAPATTARPEHPATIVPPNVGPATFDFTLPAHPPIEYTTAAKSTSATSISPSTDPSHPPLKTPQPILPDKVQPTIRPEEFLPYFQIPGSARHPGDVTLLVPATKAPPSPDSLPPSSATYTQTPK